MAQHAKPVDITKSYVVTDPNAFPNNQGFTQGEDSPSQLPPILAFEGYNFIPTSYGYKSFFGANSTLNIQALPSRCDRMFLFQLMAYQNILVALCEDGIWVCFPAHPGNTWSQWVAQPLPAAGAYREWTHCIIENNLYCYREGDMLVHKISSLGIPHNTAPAPSTVSIGVPYNNSQIYIAEGTYDVTAAQIVGTVPSAITTSVGSITLAAGDSFDVVLGGYVGNAILYFSNRATGVIYSAMFYGLTVAPTVFANIALQIYNQTVASLPDQAAFSYLTSFVPNTVKNYATTAARLADTTLAVGNVDKMVYDFEAASYFLLTNITPTWRPASIVASTGLNADFRHTLNMAGQKGIFRANARLGFWDSANSISWSDLADITNFTPSVETRAGYATFSGVKGAIVTILAQGDGFVIYTTKGIVGVRFINDLSLVWEATIITDAAGVAYDREVTAGITDLEHFAYTNTGIKRIGAFNALNKSHQFEDIIPEVFDLLKEQREPVYLDFLNGRFLFFSVINPNYIYSKTSFVFNTVDSVLVRVLINGGQWDGITIPPYVIDGISSQLQAGVTAGQYSAWVATGKAISNNFTTPMHPYELDSLSQHVPNAANVAKKTFLYTGTADSLQVEVALSYCQPPNITSPVDLTLGWTFPGINNTGAAYLGLMDDFLYGFRNTFVGDEGTFFTQVQTLNRAAIAAVLPFYSTQNPAANPATADPAGTVYGSSAAWMAAITSMATSVGGTVPVLDSYVYPYDMGGRSRYNWTSVLSRTRIGDILSGARVPPVETLIGVGTYQASYSFVNNFRGGHVVNRVVTRHYRENHTSSLVSYVNGQLSDSITARTMDYWDVITLELVPDATITGSSTITATQKTLDWAYIPQGADPGNFSSTYGAVAVSGLHIPGASTLPIDLNVSYPGANFLISNGSPAPIYPTFSGALVFDTSLKKWGKSKNSYRTIFDMAPLNSIDSSINFTNFGVNMAQLDPAGVIKIYDARPADSWIRYGKIGYYRQGMTKAQEIRASFRTSSNGNIFLDTSIDGRALELTLHNSYPFTAAADVTGYFSSVGRWHTITVSGQWDLQYLEFRGNSAGRR